MNDPNSPRLAAILLAAGPSSRLGYPKQLVKVEGEALVRRTARLILGLEPELLLAVCGHEQDKVCSELGGLKLDTLYNPDWKQGMGGSIVAGARALPESVGGILVMVCDQWRLEAAELQAMVEAWRQSPQRICVANWKEGAAFVSGPPAIFPVRLLRDLRAMDKHRGARQVIDSNMDIVDFVEIPSAAWDLDRPEDLKLMLEED